MRALAMVLFSASTALAGGLGDLELAPEKLSLLNGRLEVRLPKGAAFEAMQEGLMAAPESNERESRLVLDVGPERVVLMAWEIFKSAGDDLEKAIKADSQGAKVEALSPGEKARGWKVERPALDASGEAIEVAHAVIADPAGYLTSVALYVNPAAAREDEAGSRALAAKVFASLRIGPRKLALEARDATLERGITVHLPAGWVTSSQDGPDFVVYDLQGIVPFGTRGPRLGVYLGNHPGWLHERQQGVTVETKPTTLLGAKTEWHCWSAGNTRTLEAMVPLDNGRVAHVFVTASEGQVDQARAVAESLARETK